jgi:transcriptional regulator with PAS, ATPase and Fis domain
MPCNDDSSPLAATADKGGHSDATRRITVFSERGSRSIELPVHGVLTVGRGDDCDISIDGHSISRVHLRVHVADLVRVEDLGSRNGTRIGGRPLAPGVLAEWREGTTVEIGDGVLLREPGALPRKNQEPANLGTVGDAMRDTLRLVELAARSTISVILLGETGVGKDVLSERIHASSDRRSKPFIGINCATIGDALIESALFGHERGAFTGAVQTKAGLLEAAHGGTVLLDELGELPLATQAKLLRALEKRELTRVGGVKSIPFDVRFVAATNCDLEELVKEGAFRSDLYFRLNGLTIRIPPLRARKAEIESLVKSFVAEICRRSHGRAIEVSPEALAVFQAHSWPGNIRELKNTVERAVLLCPDDLLTPEHVRLDSNLQSRLEEPRDAGTLPVQAAAGALRDEVAILERLKIVEALDRAGGNQTLAAEALGISRRMLVYRLGRYDIPRGRKKA